MAIKFNVIRVLSGSPASDGFLPENFTTTPHGGSSGSLPFPVEDISFEEAFTQAFDFIKGGLSWVFDFLRHTYLFGHFSLLSLFITCIVFDLIFAAFFVTFNIYGMRDKMDNVIPRRKK